MPYIGRNHIAGDHTSNFKVLDDISSHTATFNGSSSSIVSTADNTLRIPEHRFLQGQRVTYSNGGGGNIGGLTNGTAYFVTSDTSNTIKLATTLANANNNTNINLTSVGSGSAHTLTVAFDSVNTTFKITHGGGLTADIVNSSQLSIAINNVIQKPNVDSSYTEGFLVLDTRKIQFKTAPTSNDIFWGTIIANTIETFDISDNKIDNFTGDGSTTTFSLSKEPPNNESIIVTLDGVTQHPNDKDTTRSYRLVTSVLEFTSAPPNGTEIQVRHIGFAGASTSDVSGFYGRTGNVVLGASDNITVGNINVGTGVTIESNGQGTYTGIVTALQFSGDGSGLTGVANTDFVVGTAITMGTANFTGNVTIGGTLTYEDVTNIDSVGVITARNDIKVGSGVTLTPAGAGFFAGIVTATSFAGDGANITGVAVTEAPVLSYEIFGPNNHQYFWWGGGVDNTEPNPDLFLQRGQMYRFVNNAGSGHPLEIRYAQSGPEFTSGVRGSKTGVQLFTVPYDAPAKLRYQCVPHTNMGGAIYIRGADGNQEKVGLTTFKSELTATNAISIKSDDSNSGRVKFYCEFNNIHYVTLRAPAHADFSGYPVVTLPNETGILALNEGSKTIKVGTGVTIEPNGQATFTGIVTFGSSSTTIDGDANTVKVGTALTLGHTQGVQFHTQNLHSQGFEVNQINATGIITATSLSSSGDTNTKINFPAADTITAETGGDERLRIDSNGKLLGGNYFTSKQIGAVTAPVQIQGTTADTSALSLFRYSNDTGGSTITLGKGRGTSGGAIDKPQEDDTVGTIHFHIANNNDLVNGNVAAIDVQVDAEPGGADTPGRIRFLTSPDGSSTLAERLRIASNGAIGLGGANYGSSGQVLTSQGSSSAPTWATPSGGKILQTVNATATSQVERTSSGFADTGLTANITLSAANKVLIFVAQSLEARQYNATGFAVGRLKLVRITSGTYYNVFGPGGRSIVTSGPGSGSYFIASGCIASIVAEDSPGVGTHTYATQIARTVGGGGTAVRANSDGHPAEIILMEVES